MRDNSWNGRERNLLFLNIGDGMFSDTARPMRCDEVEESRGVAVADLDRDGRVDIVLSNNDAPPTIYLNRLPETGNWCRFHLTGAPGSETPSSSRDALGTRVVATVQRDGTEQRILREVTAGSGYAAQSQAGVHFGLGKGGVLTALEIKWPSGREVRLDGESLDGILNGFWMIREGSESELNTWPAVSPALARD